MHLCLTQGHRYIGAMYDIVTYTISAIGTKAITKGHRDTYRIYMKYKCIHILWQYRFHHIRQNIGQIIANITSTEVVRIRKIG